MGIQVLCREIARQCSLPGGRWEIRYAGNEICLRLYGRNVERIGSFRFLGVYFDTRLTWAEHIESVVGKCKKVLNVMRCLTGKKWIVWNHVCCIDPICNTLWQYSVWFGSPDLIGKARCHTGARIQNMSRGVSDHPTGCTTVGDGGYAIAD